MKIRGPNGIEPRFQADEECSSVNAKIARYGRNAAICDGILSNCPVARKPHLNMVQTSILGRIRAYYGPPGRA